MNQTTTPIAFDHTSRGAAFAGSLVLGAVSV